ncbi:MAG: dihydrolipoamide acetyltransferase family protein [Rhodocyclaceae bacterium]
MIDFKLPSLGADMDAGKLLEWKVAPGQQVKKGDVVAVVDTSKAAVEVEIWQDGTVHELLTRPGETVPVGSVMARLLAPGETPPAPRGEGAAAAPVPSAPSGGEGAMRRRVSPAARRRAEETGIDLQRIAGTGPGGAVTLEDVERAARAPVPVEAARAPGDRQAQMRAAIAAAMARSKREIPHYYLAETIPMKRALDWLTQANAARPVTQRLLPAVLLLKAVALATRKVPEMNGFFREGAFRPAASAHLGVAISLRQGGLIAPAIHDVADKPLDALMRELADLARRARAGSLRSSEMSDPTLTVTNLGETGVESVFGVIYPPQVALVGFGRIAERPWAHDGAIFALPAITASLSADHRVSDGHRGALFLAEIRELLQRPDNL